MRIPPASLGMLALAGLALVPAAAGPLHAQDVPGLSLYGVPGHVEMPSAFPLPDGTFAFSVNQHTGNVRRGNLVFQITPRLTGTFRYSYLQEYLSSGDDLYDRSFDLKFRFIDEDLHGWRPAVAVGLQDFGGTGIFGAEYLVASKHFGPRITASAGIGWGRFGSHGSFRNPLSLLSDRFDRRGSFTGQIEETGRIGFDQFFRGEAAVFLAADWQATDRLRLSFEYSSDAMEAEVARMGYEHRTPINLGAEFSFGNGSTLGLSVLSGSAVALSYSLTLDPARPAAPSGREPAPPAIGPGQAEAAASWGPVPDAARRDRLARALEAEGIRLEALTLEGQTARVAIRNDRWPATAQALGRTARLLSRELPADIGQFRIETRSRGMPVTAVTLSRADLEELEYAPDGAWQILARSGAEDAVLLPPDPRLRPGQSFDWRLRPYADPSLFDPDSPLRMDLGLEVLAEWSPLPGLHFAGALRQHAVGTIGDATRPNNSRLPHVRSDAVEYARVSGPYLAFATGDYFTRPGEDLYARMTAGYLERMFAGVSGELLWAPSDRRYALGVEVNYTWQRDFDGGFGLTDYEIATGHVSGYYDFGGGYLGQVDVGRYLAGDWGSTVSLVRRYGNGFQVGAFFTLTEIGFEEFGEGSFDKGIMFSVPLTWLSGQPSRSAGNFTIRPIQRDGGARLHVQNRLFGLTLDEREAARGDRWGRFWR